MLRKFDRSDRVKIAIKKNEFWNLNKQFILCTKLILYQVEIFPCALKFPIFLINLLGIIKL